MRRRAGLSLSWPMARLHGLQSSPRTLPVSMAMIDAQPAGGLLPADGADAALARQHEVEIPQRHAVEVLELRIAVLFRTIGALLRAAPGIFRRSEPPLCVDLVPVGGVAVALLARTRARSSAPCAHCHCFARLLREVTDVQSSLNARRGTVRPDEMTRCTKVHREFGRSGSPARAPCRASDGGRDGIGLLARAEGCLR